MKDLHLKGQGKTVGKKYASERECEIHRAGSTDGHEVCVKGCSASLVSGEFKLKQK